jgi:hypothetical protein
MIFRSKESPKERRHACEPIKEEAQPVVGRIFDTGRIGADVMDIHLHPSSVEWKHETT